jgi:O-antigen/teichoic acid export membrane protein
VRDDPVYAFAAATALSQVFPAIVAPLLSRLYSPAAFGGYATFYAIVAIASTVAAFSMHNAILTEPDDDDAAIATTCSLVAPILFAALFSLVLAVTPDAILHAVFPSIAPDLLRWLPLTILVAVVFQIGYTWLLRSGKYRELAANKLLLAAATAGLQIAIGLAQLETLGFILANLAGYGVALVAVWRLVLQDHRFTRNWPRASALRAFYRKHHRFATYTTPAQLVNGGSNYLPDLMIGRLFGAEVLGQYSLGMRMVVMPLAFVATTAQDVYRRESAREHAETGGSQRTFRKGFTIMSSAAVFLLLPVILSLPFLFPVVFGARWADAGHYVLAMAALLLVRFVSSPLSYTWIVAGKQRQDLFWQVGLLALTVATLSLPLYWLPGITPTQLFLVYGNSVAGWYLLALYFSYRWSHPSR